MSKRKKIRIVNRKVLVDSLQLRFVGIAIIYFSLIVLIFVSTLFVPIVMRLQGGDINSPQVQEAAHEFLVLHHRVWLPLLGALVVIVLHNIIFTHRVAGPLYRFRPYLETVGGGDLSAPIKFRQKDHLQKEAEVASRMVESLRDKVMQVEEQFEKADRAWIELRSALDEGAGIEMRQKIDAVSERIEGCRASLSVFTTGDKPAPAAGTSEKARVKDPV
jgi:methyl-accepting chemotaxis protein